jgi:hypothetical protein
MRLTFTLQSAYTGSTYVAGPFNISGRTSGGVNYQLSTGVTKTQLTTGHTVDTIYETITGGTIVSTGSCNTSQPWSLTPPPTTSTFNFLFESGTYYFYLTNPLTSNLTINVARVALHTSAGCSTNVDDANLDAPVTLLAGATSVAHTTVNNNLGSITHIKPYNQITFATHGSKVDGGTFVVGTCTVTVDLNNTCQVYAA